MSSQTFITKSYPSSMHDHLAYLLSTYTKSREEKLPSKVAELIVRILLLRPSWRNKVEEEWNKSEIQNFVHECFQFYFDINNISSITVKIQCFFYGKYLTKEQFTNHKKNIILKNCNYLLQKLKKVWHNPGEDFSEMHSDLVKFILIKEGMDDTEDLSAYDEIKTALDSLLPATELSIFVTNNQKTKVAFIYEISSIASGIRLHAWYNKKAGKYLFDVVKLMKETMPKVSEEVHEELSKVIEKKNYLQAFLKEKIAEDGDNAEFNFKKQLLINTVNYTNFIKILKESLEDIAAETYRLDYKFTMCIKELNAVLKSGPFIKADKAYPLYKDLSQTWKNLQLEGYLLDFYTNLFLELKELNETVFKIQEPQNIEQVDFDDVILGYPEEKPSLLSPKTVKNFDEITLETRDFCTYYCSFGILVPIVKGIGVVMFKNLYYGFSSHKAMEYFLQQPNACIEIAKKYMQIMPELIITICKETSFGFPVINMLEFKEVLPILIAEKSNQTALHSTEKNIDEKYNWNQWSMRKEAIKHVDLMNKKTHSTQTNLSHFRRENFSQVYLPKDNWTQTNREVGTTMNRAGIPEL